MAGRGVSSADRDSRSLRLQIQEDDDVIELDEGVVDHGDAVTKCLDESSTLPGCSPGSGKGPGSDTPACRVSDDPDDQLN